MKSRNKHAGLIMTLCMLALLYSGGMTVVKAETCVDVIPDQLLADTFERFTVTGITTPLPGPDPNPAGFPGAAFLRAGDLDGDGQKEIIVTSGSGASGLYNVADGAVAVFARTSEDLSTWTQSVIQADFAWPNDMVIRDVTGDGEVDIMVFDNFLAGQYTNNPAGIYVLKNLGGDITDPGNWEKTTLYAEDPAEAGIDVYARAKRRGCYHQGYLLDLDGDGREDLVTTRISMEIWQAKDPQSLLYNQQYMWTEWFRAEADLATYPSGFSGPYAIGDGIGFLIDLHDVDDDGLLDVIGPQFFITNSGSLIIKGSPDGTDPNGDSLVWFKNPGQDVLATDPNYGWERYTIDNWYTSPNPVGKAFAFFPADITNDGSDELIAVSHNHQDYVNDQRIWPSGLYYLSIPEDPYASANWTPVAIDTGDAYLVDRPGGPYSQGSPGTTAVGDITGDGLTDIVVAGDGRGAIYYYEAEQADGGCSLQFKRTALYDDPASMPAEVKLYDIDGDDELEVLGTVYDTSFAKDSSASSVFIWKMIGPEKGLLQIDKCKVKAGKKDSSDSIQFSGLLDAEENDFTVGGDVVVIIDADAIPDLSETTFIFPVDKGSLKKGKYKSPKDTTDPVASVQIDTNKGTIKFSAKKADLTGLGCPITIRIQIGGYSAAIVLDEDIVNGPQKPCPPELMVGM